MLKETLESLQPGQILVHKSSHREVEILEIKEAELTAKDISSNETTVYTLKSIRTLYDLKAAPAPEPMPEVKVDKYLHIKEMRQEIIDRLSQWGNVEFHEAKLYTGIYAVASTDDDNKLKRLICMLYKKVDRLMIQTRPYPELASEKIEVNIAANYHDDYQFKIRTRDDLPELMRIIELAYNKVNDDLSDLISEAVE